MEKLMNLFLVAIIFGAVQGEEQCPQKRQANIGNRLIDQDFGLELTPDDLITSMMSPFMFRDYYRPWRYMEALTRDLGSTIKSEKDKFTINLDVQHFAPEEISVKTADGYVTIEAKHEEKKDEHGSISRHQKQWLKLASRHDLLDKDMEKLRKTIRFCSRHFPPNAIVNRHLSQDALPSKSLPGSIDEDEPDSPERHEGIICDSCQDPVQGFRYKCVTCDNFDLCQKCEMLERHPHHYMLRIPKSIKFKLADDLINKWRYLFLKEHVLPECDSSSDDEPVTKYIKTYDSGIDLTEDVKNAIRNEVTRALKVAKAKVPTQVLKEKEKRPNKRKEAIPIVEYKEVKIDEAEEQGDYRETQATPELVFADVNEELKFDQADVKPPMMDTSPAIAMLNNPNITVENQPLLYVTLSNDLSQFMIELADNNASGSGLMK
nr:uncharacterized protein LOC117993118 [Maniola hyperantus]